MQQRVSLSQLLARTRVDRKIIGLATSRDRVQWERHPRPVLVPDTSWEQPYLRTVLEQGSRKLVLDGGVQAPSVVWNSEKQAFEMLYEGHTMLGRQFSALL